MKIVRTFTPPELIATLRRFLLRIECLLEQGQVFPDHGESDETAILQHSYMMSGDQGRGLCMHELPFTIVRDILMIMGENSERVMYVVTRTQLDGILAPAREYLRLLDEIEEGIDRNAPQYPPVDLRATRKKMNRKLGSDRLIQHKFAIFNPRILDRRAA